MFLSGLMAWPKRKLWSRCPQSFLKPGLTLGIISFYHKKLNEFKMLELGRAAAAVLKIVDSGHILR